MDFPAYGMNAESLHYGFFTPFWLHHINADCHHYTPPVPHLEYNTAASDIKRTEYHDLLFLRITQTLISIATDCACVCIRQGTKNGEGKILTWMPELWHFMILCLIIALKTVMFLPVIQTIQIWLAPLNISQFQSDFITFANYVQD